MKKVSVVYYSHRYGHDVYVFDGPVEVVEHENHLAVVMNKDGDTLLTLDDFEPERGEYIDVQETSLRETTA